MRKGPACLTGEGWHRFRAPYDVREQHQLPATALWGAPIATKLIQIRMRLMPARQRRNDTRGEHAESAC